jgi:hypothetical protein
VLSRHGAIFRRGGSWNRSLTLEIELLAGKPRNAEKFHVVGNENRPDAERGSGNNGIRQFELVLPPETDSQVFTSSLRSIILTSERKSCIWDCTDDIQRRIGEELYFRNDGNQVLTGREALRHLTAQELKNGVGIKNSSRDHSCRMRVWYSRGSSVSVITPTQRDKSVARASSPRKLREPSISSQSA